MSSRILKDLADYVFRLESRVKLLEQDQDCDYGKFLIEKALKNKSKPPLRKKSKGT